MDIFSPLAQEVFVSSTGTLFCGFPTAVVLLVTTHAGSLVLQSREKSVIPYRIGSEPSVCKGSSQHTSLKKAYRRYAFAPSNACSNPIEHITTPLNMEV